MRTTASLSFTCLSLTIFVGACAARTRSATEPVQKLAGQCVPAFGSPICTWAEMSGSKINALGATVPMAAIENSPSDGPMVWPPVPNAVVAMPAQVRTATGIDHLTVYWEHHGHPPTPFLTPHFDFHFYSISDPDRRLIDCTNKTKPATLTTGYSLPDLEITGIGMLTGLCVQGMGMHSLEAVALGATTPFEGTMVLGYYNARPIFFEPMIAKAKLMQKESFVLPLPTPPGLQSGVHYPTKFEAVYDASIPGYKLVFSGFSG